MAMTGLMFLAIDRKQGLMPSKQHEQWKRDLFNHLDGKLSGCIACEFGEGRDSHAPHASRAAPRAVPANPVDVRTHAPPRLRSTTGSRLRSHGAATVRPSQRQMPPRSHYIGRSSRAPGFCRDRPVQSSFELTMRGEGARHSAVYYPGTSQAFAHPWSWAVPTLVGL